MSRAPSDAALPPADSSAPLLDVRGLCVSYGRQKAVEDVSFSLLRGRCLGIAGESGSGKSTLARAILGLEPAVSSGEVLFRGRDVLSMSARERKAFRSHAQMVFQDPYGSLNPRLSVGDALSEVLRVHGIARGAGALDRARDALASVALGGEFLSRKPHEMSGGQRQRVNIARALCVGAELLVADEPASALDVSVQAQILNLLKDLQRRRGLTLIVIGHDLAALRYLADDMLVMRAGRRVLLADAATATTAPDEPYTASLLRAVPDVERALAERQGKNDGSWI
jgi:ABC-type glutathione transport system ATPase component